MANEAINVFSWHLATRCDIVHRESNEHFAFSSIRGLEILDFRLSIPSLTFTFPWLQNVSFFGYSRKTLTDKDLRSMIASTLTCRIDHQ